MGSCGISRKTTNSVILNNSTNRVNQGDGSSSNFNGPTTNNPNNSNNNNINNNNNSNLRNLNNENNRNQPILPSPNTQNANTNSNMNNINLNLDEKFKDLEEYENEFSGEGIKRIKAYKWNHPFDKLYKLRMDFWSSKKDNKKIWATIKQACESDHLSAQGLLLSLGIMPVDGTMKMLIDNTDNIYEVPNFCINDPLHKKEIQEKNIVPVEILKIGIVDMFNPSKVSYIKIPNNVNCLELKKCYADAKKLDLHKHKIRAIYQGAEILDDQTLGQHNLKTNSKIQFAIRQLSDSEINKENEDKSPKSSVKKRNDPSCDMENFSRKNTNQNQSVINESHVLSNNYQYNKEEEENEDYPDHDSKLDKLNSIQKIKISNNFPKTSNIQVLEIDSKNSINLNSESKNNGDFIDSKDKDIKAIQEIHSKSNILANSNSDEPEFESKNSDVLINKKTSHGKLSKLSSEKGNNNYNNEYAYKQSSNKLDNKMIEIEKTVEKDNKSIVGSSSININNVEKTVAKDELNEINESIQESIANANNVVDKEEKLENIKESKISMYKNSNNSNNSKNSKIFNSSKNESNLEQ